MDDWGRIIEITTPEGGTEKYTYDYAGNITSSTDANGNTIQYEFNEHGKVKKIIDPEGNAEYLTYDAEGNLRKQLDRNNNTIEYGFKLDGNLTYRKGTNPTTGQALYEKYAYNLDGTLHQAISGAMAYTYQYTAEGFLKSKHASGKTLIAYEYNKNNKIASIADITGNITRYTYDPVDRVKEIMNKDSNTLARYSYSADNSVQKITYGNGIETRYHYDGDKNVIGLTSQTAGGKVLTAYSYAYDTNGNRTEKNGLSSQTKYSYDSMNRLKQAVYGSRTESYTYDFVGNRLSKETGNQVEKYLYNAKNQLTQRENQNGITKYSYDKQGNTLKELTTEGINTFEYNVFNQQSKVTTKEGNTLVSRYDAEGLRTEIEENENRVKFIFHKENIIAETDANDAPISTFARGFEVVSADIKTQEDRLKHHYYHQDEQGSTATITDDQGEVQNQYEYDAFGVVLNATENVHNRITYTGQQYDGITQQYYLRARYYNPVIGRFTQEDIYRGDGLNLYAYCKNNPVIYYDPSGYWVTVAIGAGIGAAFGFGSTLISQTIQGSLEEGKLSFKKVNGWDLLVNTASGAASGALAGTGYGLAVQIGGNAALGGISSAAMDKLNGRPIDPTNLVSSMILGAAGGAAGGPGVWHGKGAEREAIKALKGEINELILKKQIYSHTKRRIKNYKKGMAELNKELLSGISKAMVPTLISNTRSIWDDYNYGKIKENRDKRENKAKEKKGTCKIVDWCTEVA